MPDRPDRRGIIVLKFSIALILLAVAVLFGIGSRGMRQQEPAYLGRPLSFWLEGFQLDNEPGKPTPNEAVEAVRDAGTNSIPILLNLLRSRDSELKRKVISMARRLRIAEIRYVTADSRQWVAVQGFYALGRRAKYAVPALVEMYEEQSSRNEPRSNRLGYITELLEMLKNEDAGVSPDIAKAVNEIIAKGAGKVGGK